MIKHAMTGAAMVLALASYAFAQEEAATPPGAVAGNIATSPGSTHEWATPSVAVPQSPEHVESDHMAPQEGTGKHGKHAHHHHHDGKKATGEKKHGGHKKGHHHHKGAAKPADKPAAQ